MWVQVTFSPHNNKTKISLEEGGGVSWAVSHSRETFHALVTWLSWGQIKSYITFDRDITFKHVFIEINVSIIIIIHVPFDSSGELPQFANIYHPTKIAPQPPCCLKSLWLLCDRFCGSLKLFAGSQKLFTTDTIHVVFSLARSLKLFTQSWKLVTGSVKLFSGSLKLFPKIFPAVWRPGEQFHGPAEQF